MREIESGERHMSLLSNPSLFMSYLMTTDKKQLVTNAYQRIFGDLVTPAVDQ
jgi:hypothetical protein